MRAVRVSGTENYADEAPELLKRYESISFADHHRLVMHLIPTAPSRVLDIGAGTGRDAAGFAALGHSVVAVEPTEELRSGAIRLHPSPIIEWLDDSLPDLAVVRARDEEFVVVMLTAVWMHLDGLQRRQAMPGVAALVRNGGVVIMSLRHGPVPPGRRMFEVTAEETIALAQPLGLCCILNQKARSSLRQPGVTWTRLAFRKEPAVYIGVNNRREPAPPCWGQDRGVCLLLSWQALAGSSSQAGAPVCWQVSGPGCPV
jgi:SAM-dependent methyltransferase